MMMPAQGVSTVILENVSIFTDDVYPFGYVFL